MGDELVSFVHVPAAQVRAQVVAILTAWGMPEAHVHTTAEVMLATDLSGVDSHGISMLMDYDRSRSLGKINIAAQPKVVRQSAVTALVDADAGLGHPAAVMGMQLAIEKAKAAGLAAVAVRNSHHFGAAGHYAALAAQQGLVGLVTSATRTMGVVPTRAAQPLLGTNPIAFAAPAGRNRPFLLDMATSTVAANKVRVHALRGQAIPAGWVLNAAGQPIEDAAAATETIFGTKQGGLTPLGGVEAMASYKGYGLAMMVHILGGVLSGASFSPIRTRTQRPEDPDDLGHFFMALDPGAFRMDGGFEGDLDDAIDLLHAASPIDPARPVLVAGDPEAEKRAARLQDGIPLPAALVTQLREVCTRCGAAFLL